MQAKTYRRLLQAGIIASLLIILSVFKELLFPFITSKQLPFNILMEFLLVIWLVFIWRYPQYRPRKNFISVGLVVYFLAILASCLVSVDFNLSFWGDAERMLGFFHLAHFLIFYFILITVFRTWQDWQLLFGSSVAVATLVSLIGLLGENGYSTIGNTAYVSGYLIFSIYFTVILFFRTSNKQLRWLYLFPLVIMLLEFKNMKTSGAIIGLGVSVLIMILLVGLTHVNKKVRRLSLVIFMLALLALAGIFSQREAAWFQNSFLKNLTSQKVTFQTRLISWRGAAADFKYHPIFGTGFGNYAVIFDKHFTSKFYDYTTGDTYFDRAHNNLIDIVSTTGLVGLVSYLSIFAAVGYYLFREFKANGYRSSGEYHGLNNIEVITIISLLSAYFIQNLAIFDSFSTFLGLMSIFGFIYWLNQRRQGETDDRPEPKMVIKNESTELLVLGGLLLIAFIFCNHYNFKTWKMFKQTIDGYAQIASGRLETGAAIYKEALSDRPLERDSRVTLINLVSSNLALFDTVSKERATEIFDYTISLAKKNVSYHPGDSMMQLQLAQVLDVAARYHYQDLEKFNLYSTEAMQAVAKSIEASPKRATTYFVKAQMQLMRMENEEAIKTMEQAISLNPNYSEGHCRLAQMFFLIDEPQYGSALSTALNACVDKGGVATIVSENMLKLAINHYSDVKDYERAAVLSERLASISEPDPEVWYNLAKLNYVIGNVEKAEETFLKALFLDSSLEGQWPIFKGLIDANR